MDWNESSKTEKHSEARVQGWVWTVAGARHYLYPNRTARLKALPSGRGVSRDAVWLQPMLEGRAGATKDMSAGKKRRT